MITLVLDASGASASVALVVDGECRAHGEVAMRNREREVLLPLVLDVVAQTGMRVDAVQRIVLGEGPGAFTSLRIAAATAKGLAHGTAVQLAACSSLVLLAASWGEAPHGARRLVLTDALRGDRYAQPVERATTGWRPLAPGVIIAASEVAAASVQWSADVLDATRTARAVDARAWLALDPVATRVISLAEWEPRYGRLAEAQVKWESAAGHALPTMAPVVDLGGRG